MKNLSQKLTMVALPIAGVVGLVVVLCLGVRFFRTDSGEGVEKAVEQPQKTKKPVSSSKPAAAGRKTTAKPVAVGQKLSQKSAARGNRPMTVLTADELYSHLEGEDRELCEKIQEALDDDNFTATLAIAKKAFASKNPEVRQNAVEALGWFGAKSLSALMPMMADSDADVAQAARDAWEMGLGDVEDAALKLSAAQLALSALNDEDALSMIGMEYTSAAFELIDGEESEAIAQNRRMEVVRFLTELITSSQTGAGAEVRRETGKELYEQITNHEWVSAAEAERYLQDPENYEPPETDAEPPHVSTF